MRGGTWISAPMPREPVELDSEKEDARITDKEAAHPSTGQYFYTPEEQRKLSSDPEYLLNYRKRIEYAINEGFAIFYKDSDASNMAFGYMKSEMDRRLKNDPVLTNKLIPTWPVGCRYDFLPHYYPPFPSFFFSSFSSEPSLYGHRRLTPGDGYLEALIEPNVVCHFSEVARVNEKGLNTQDGALHEVDMIVCATGYDMAWTPHFTLIGRNGVNIKDAWNPEPKCYLGIAAPGFPNYFVMNGPRANLANGTVLPCFETELDYVIKAVRKMQDDRIRTMDVREKLVTQLDQYIDAWQQTSVFSGPCRSWYKDNTVDGKVRVWGGSVSENLSTRFLVPRRKTRAVITIFSRCTF